MHAIYGLVETFNIGSVQVHRQHPQFLQPVQWQQTSIVLFSCVKVVSLPWMPVIDNIPTFLFKKRPFLQLKRHSTIHKSIIIPVSSFSSLPSFCFLQKASRQTSICGKPEEYFSLLLLLLMRMMLLALCALLASQKTLESLSVSQNLRCLSHYKLVWQGAYKEGLLLIHYGLTDSQCSVHLWSSLRCRNQASPQCFQACSLSVSSSLLVQAYWAELLHSLVIGQVQSVWYTVGLTSYGGDTHIDMSLMILCPSTCLPPIPFVLMF